MVKGRTLTSLKKAGSGAAWTEGLTRMRFSKEAWSLAALVTIVVLPLAGERATGAEYAARAATAEAELQRAGLIRGRPGGDVAAQKPITKGELALLVDNVLARLRPDRATVTPAPDATPSATVPAWLLQLKNTPRADFLAGLKPWSNAQTAISRQDAIAYVLRTSLSAVPVYESNPIAHIPKVADDTQIEPSLKPIIYLGLVRNLVHVDRRNRLRPRDPELRGDAMVMEYDILSSAMVRR